MNVAILTAAGVGSKFGQDVPKQFLSIDDKPLSELSDVNKFLMENKYILFIKPHPLEVYKYKDIVTIYSNIIILLGDEFSNTQEYLHYFDILISDYSSITYDYLCLNRPIILFTYDIEEFKKTDMGIRDDYISLLPGPQCISWKEVCKCICSLFKNDCYADKRGKLMPRYYHYLDADNSKHVFDAIIKLI